MKLQSHPKYVALTAQTWPTYADFQAKVKPSFWRPCCHITPVAGLLNDPNGFCYWQNQYHLFYQWYPFGVMHGMKHWAHVRSNDLVHWSAPTLALAPTDDYDARGVYSGGACVIEHANGASQMNLYYTGNLKYEDGSRNATQCIATVEGDTVTKYGANPVIPTVPAGYTGHVRDPKVFKVGNEYRMLLGAQTTDKTGGIVVYRSKDGFDWQWLGALDVRFASDLMPIIGYMWECPDYFQLDGQDVLIFSPQGIAADGYRFHNEFNVIYCLGKVDWEKLTFDVDTYQELDRGFDFYAPQTLENHPQGERVLSAWASCGDPDFPSDSEGWTNCLTIARTLSIKNNRLYQQPIAAITSLFQPDSQYTAQHQGSQLSLLTQIGPHFHTRLQLSNLKQNRVDIALLAVGASALHLVLDAEKNIITLDKSQLQTRVRASWGEERSADYIFSDQLELEILVDGSIVEIFIAGGELVFTARIFADAPNTDMQLVSNNPLHCQIVTHVIEPSIDLTAIDVTALTKANKLG